MSRRPTRTAPSSASTPPAAPAAVRPQAAPRAAGSLVAGPDPMPHALQRVLLSAADLAISLDSQGRIVHCLVRDAALAERLAPHWPGQLLTDTLETASRTKLLALLQATDRGDPPVSRHLNHLLPGPPAVELPVLYSATHYPSSGLVEGPRWLLTGRDLRDTVALQQRLVDAQQSLERDHWRYREAETRFRSLFHGSTEAVLLADGALRVLEANPAAQRLLDGLRPRRGRTASGPGGGLPGASALNAGPGPTSSVLPGGGVPLLTLLSPASAEAVGSAAATARSLGRQERVAATLSDGSAVMMALSPYEQDGAAGLLIRLQPVGTERTDAGTPARAEALAAAAAAALEGGDAGPGLAQAYVRMAADALVFTDINGRVVRANRAFARLAQLSHERQAEGETLDHWLGRSGVELQVLLANLRDGGNPGLLGTELRGALGLNTPVEVAATALMPPPGAGVGGPVPRYVFCLRDTGRRLAPGEEALPKVPSSVKQLSELVGRVPLKQIVAETSDLIEKLSIEAALQMTRDNRALAAQMLGLSRQSLYVKLRRFGMGGLGGDGEEAAEEPSAS